MKLVVSSILMLCPRQLPPSAEEATNFHLKFVAYQSMKFKFLYRLSFLVSFEKFVCGTKEFGYFSTFLSPVSAILDLKSFTIINHFLEHTTMTLISKLQSNCPRVSKQLSHLTISSKVLLNILF